ncbi:MAG: elongation factor Ts [Oscillospiraceae bacterium]|nr:elongation factor Ts [Oscillospiraceae bacterium]
MAFTAQDVKNLREKTGVGMMECKKALTEADGDMDKAFEYLRERGLAAATKKASRVAAEGAIIAYTDEATKTTVLLEINSETDFVGKNEKFQAFGNDVAKTIAENKPASVEELLALTLCGSDRTVEENLHDMVLSIGENLKIRRFEILEGDVVTYIHGGGAVGVAVQFETNLSDKAEFVAMGKNIAMQIAAMSPEYLSKDCISAEELEKMKSITIDSSLNKPDSLPKPIQSQLFEKACNEKLFSDEDIAAYEENKKNPYLFNFLSKEAVATLAELAVSGKAEYMNNKIFAGAVEGRIKKQLKEICLLEQTFVRSDLFDGTVAGYVAQVAKTNGADIKVAKFIRLEKGEGIEKRVDDFASEVASMMK